MARELLDELHADGIDDDQLHLLMETLEKTCDPDVALRNLEKIHARIGDAIQVAYICGNDFGTQNSPFCSAETFRELYAQRAARRR